MCTLQLEIYTYIETFFLIQLISLESHLFPSYQFDQLFNISIYVKPLNIKYLENVCLTDCTGRLGVENGYEQL